MEINVIGGGWVTAGGYGVMHDGLKPVLIPGKPVFPRLGAIYARPPARHRRFDAYTRIGCAAISLALKDAGLTQAKGRRPVGIVVSSVYECLEVDLAYYATARDNGGLFASPHLFSYTLPGIVTGEAAIHFGLTGPTFTVGDSAAGRGYPALAVTVNMIRAGTCETMVSGWLDSPGNRLAARARNLDPVCGGVFLVLSAGYGNMARTRIRFSGPGLITATGDKIASILDLFGPAGST